MHSNNLKDVKVREVPRVDISRAPTPPPPSP
eukprot:CAMPEP_0180398088 /NCGR_PEP_ID=MMETSP0989-20121125/36413_1 /TAXON_ID=697907 /ORGANISM="non described non described, Strain CCMP2293" /LENGTH=30 /DNA_ID= /DNA_START= /DNA_END= /DNA_ORIENTATION=